MDNTSIAGVVVLAYNAENTILETLESVYQQTYQNIYLIVSDDASADSTYPLIKKWCNTKKSRFVDIKINRNNANIGTSCHFNVVFSLLPESIEWVKVIGADDILMPQCIEDNMHFVSCCHCNSIVYSKYYSFKIDKKRKIILPEDTEQVKYLTKIGKLSPQKQYKKLIKRMITFNATMFINVSCFKRIGGCDTYIRNIEDWPLALKITSNGYKIYVMNQYSVYYRIEDSYSHSKKEMFKTDFIKENYKLKKIYCYPNIKKYHILYYYKELLIFMKIYLIIKLCRNKKNLMSYFISISIGLLIPQNWGRCLFKVFSIVEYLNKNKEIRYAGN